MVEVPAADKDQVAAIAVDSGDTIPIAEDWKTWFSGDVASLTVANVRRCESLTIDDGSAGMLSVASLPERPVPTGPARTLGRTLME